MTPAFGFSVGDFISAIGLVKRITKALKETGGASAEYQLVIIELKGLKSILRHLEIFEPTGENVAHIIAIRGMALACQLPLRDFMVKLEKYESTLGPFADKKSLRATVKKSKWAVLFAEEVERLRAMVAAKNISLNLLLAMNTSQVLSRVDSKNQEKHGDLMSKAAEHRAALHKVQDGLTRVEEKVSGAEAAFNRRLGGIANDLSQARETSDCRLGEIGVTVRDTRNSLLSLRSTGEQILRRLGTFPREMHEMLQNILRANWHMYNILLKIQQSTVRSPTGLLESNIRFEDALGEYKELPYEFFRHWEPFEGFLRAQFKNKLGERKVLEGHYHIINVTNDRTIINREHWTRSIEQGSKFTMSMVMSHLQRRDSSCPRPSCSGGGVNQCHKSGLLSCKNCNLKFFPASIALQDLSGKPREEDEVARRQNEEDFFLYGSRSEPIDVQEVNVGTRSSSSPKEHTATDVRAVFDEVEKAHKVDSNSDVDKVYVCGDGDAEANPLSTWLTESALPSVISQRSHPLDQSTAIELDPVQEEIQEIETFRNVHLASSAVIDSNAVDSDQVEDALNLDLSSQIYYRNILDRYPLLPKFLARRLAEANSSRAERLSHQRFEAKAKGRSKTANLGSVNYARRTKTQSSGPVHSLSAHGRPTKERTGKSFVYQTKGEKVLDDPITVWTSSASLDKPFHYKRPKADGKRAKSYASLSKSQPQSNYWTGGSPNQRPKSVGTRSSSRNSSLHGSPKFCYQKEYQNIDYLKPSYYISPPGLPPPPAKFRRHHSSKRKVKKLSFDCEICGEHIEVDRRRQWQKHVMSDLRPYICTSRECDRATETFHSITAYLAHEIIAHGLFTSDRISACGANSRQEESIVCIFCGERTEAESGKHSRGRFFGRHIKRHMEEIAFTVVPKAYEEWDFYSESSDGKSNSHKQTKAAMPRRKSIAAGSRKETVGKASTASREATDLDAKRHGIPAGYSLRHWDPEEEPILLLGSVFDANSLGKWIYDWTVFCHGVGTPMADLAGDLWLALISLAGKAKRIRTNSSSFRSIDDETMIEDFLEGAECLWDRLKRILKACEKYMWKPVKKDGKREMGIESGREFVETLFGRDRKLETTDRLIRAMRLWIMRFDANCEDILRPGKREPDPISSKS